MAPRSKAQITKALASLTPPDALLPTQTIARIDKALGHSQYGCVLPSKDIVTADLDERFRQTVRVERGNYVLLEHYDPKNVAEGGAVGKIINVARDEKQWRKMPYWCVCSRVSHYEVTQLTSRRRPAEFPKFQDPESDEEDSRAGKMPPSDSEDDA